MKIRVSCQDKYEAQKLSSLIFLKESKETFITTILNIIENEMIVSLKDKSAHSIVFKDSNNTDAFADFLQSVIEKEHKIVDAKTFNEDVEITKS